MSATIEIENYGQGNIKGVSAIGSDINAVISAIPVQNTAGFSANDKVILGQVGTETSELGTVSSVTPPTTVNLGATTSFAHKRFEPITLLVGNQIKIYTSPNVDGTLPTDSAFSLLTTITITVDSATTTFTDPAGSNATWYKATYFNSSTSAESSLADSLAQRGGGYGHYASLDDIRAEAGFQNNTNISDARIDSYRIEAEGTINSELVAVYITPFAEPVPPLIEKITKLMAAGMLLSAEYGAVASGTSKDGAAKTALAQSYLDEIKTRVLILADSQGNSLILSSQVRGWPDDSTATSTADHAGDTMFRINTIW